MPYQPIEDHGVVGNLRTVALIAKNGSVDWFCFPRFDSPSIFASLLDQNKGGFFQIAPCDDGVIDKQFYWPDTNVLVTRFVAEGGVGEVVDYMPIPGADSDPAHYGLFRGVKVVRGSMRFRLECRPAFNYARDSHEIEVCSDGAIFHSKDLRLGLGSAVPLTIQGNGVVSEFELSEGGIQSFQFHGLDGDRTTLGFARPEAQKLLHATIGFWRRWIGKSTYRGRWRETVHRAALVLKLLTYEPTGAIVAAPTCSLPETIGGSRNWDYRYSWVRDSAFTVYSLLRIGFTDEASAFMSFLDARCHEMEPDGSLQTVYGIDGRHELPEQTLDHLEGYRGSLPVRIGNAAYQQLQLDIYGELMDSLYLYNKHGAYISHDLWVYLRRLTNWLVQHWQERDEAIWEVRGGPQDFVYSKMMCWVALDRALRMAEKRSFPADREVWIKTRDAIYETIIQRGWSGERKAFTQRFGSDALDASILMMPLVFFLAPTDPRMLQTIDAINRSPRDGGLVLDGLVFRYDVEKTPDGLQGGEGTFNFCSFLLVEALTRASQADPARLQDARLLFERMLGYANHLGLYAEEVGPRGEALGNFPLALTHLALISAAFNLDSYLDRQAGGTPTPLHRVR